MKYPFFHPQNRKHLAIWIVFLVAATLYLWFIEIDPSVIVLSWVLTLVPLLSYMIATTGQRQRFYRTVFQTLDQLEQKYVLHNVLEEPAFLDAELVQEILYITGKSMSEEINGLKYTQNEYRDYMERWVHEIKTPIAAVKLMIENQEDPQLVLEELEAVEDFVQQVLYYARSQSPEKDFFVKEIPLTSFLNDVMKKNAKKFILNKIQLDYQVFETTVFTDSKWARYIVEQILSNAIKYSKQDVKKISIWVEEQPTSVRLLIKDQGVGIAAADLGRVFEKGFTGINGRKYGQSTGMGLYLSKRLCDKLYIGIDVTSQLEVGTQVCLTFPKGNHFV